MPATRAPAIDTPHTLPAYWLIAIPLGAWLAFSWQLGAPGIWTGLAAGLAVAAIGLALRAWWKLAPHSPRKT